MILPLVVFGASLIGMIIIPLRHIPHLKENPLPESNSLVRIRVVGFIEQFEKWFHSSAKNQFLKALDNVLKIFERSFGQIAGQTKNLRLMVQERFRVIPRESLYWKQMHTWKKENGSTKAKEELYEEDLDISNHI